jgi:hypothetical protein
MDGVDIFMSMSYMEEQREWRKEERLWRTEDRLWRKMDHKWRDEDRKWRRNDRRYRQLDEIRRKTDEWVEMINDIANMSALLSGFAVAALVEAPLEDLWACLGDLDHSDSENINVYYNNDDCKVSSYSNNYRVNIWWITSFAVSTSMVAALMIGNVVAAVQTATLLLQNYNKYPWRQYNALWDTIDLRWRWITIRFYIGMILSLISLASLVILKFANSAVTCWSAASSVLLISIWLFNDAIGCCYMCSTCCVTCFPACCFKEEMRCCGCCDAPACVVMASTIQSSYSKNPLKAYHHGDNDIYTYEENEDILDGNDTPIELFDLDEYRLKENLAKTRRKRRMMDDDAADRKRSPPSPSLDGTGTTNRG